LPVHKSRFSNAGFNKPGKNRAVLREFFRQPFGMKLHAQQKRHFQRDAPGFNSIASTIPSLLRAVAVNGSAGRKTA
jgi:hypothetical protein